MSAERQGRSSGKSSVGNVVIWATIAILAILIVALTVWAARQPGVRSMWAPE